MTRDTTISLYDHYTDREFDATVTWCLTGKFLPATNDHPAENAQLEIESITDDDTGEDITEAFKHDADDIIWEMINYGRIEV